MPTDTINSNQIAQHISQVLIPNSSDHAQAARLQEVIAKSLTDAQTKVGAKRFPEMPALGTTKCYQNYEQEMALLAKDIAAKAAVLKREGFKDPTYIASLDFLTQIESAATTLENCLRIPGPLQAKS
jgi:hypothetical protein